MRRYAWNVSEAIKWQQRPGYLSGSSCMCSVQQINRTGGRGALSPQLPTSNPNPSSCYSLCLSLVPLESHPAPAPSQPFTMSTPPSEPPAESMLSGPSPEPSCLALWVPHQSDLWGHLICLLPGRHPVPSIMQLLIKFFIQQDWVYVLDPVIGSQSQD